MMDEASVESVISQLLGNKAHATISFIGVAYIEFNEGEKDLSSKVKWYLQTAELILDEDPIVSDDERLEFVKLHLKYIEKINTGQLKIPLEQILAKNSLLKDDHDEESE